MTPDQRDQIIALHQQGYQNSAIAEQLGLRPKQVGAVVTTAKNAGRLPRNERPAPSPAPPPPAVTLGVPSGAGMTPEGQATPLADDGHSWKAMPAGIGGAYAPQGYSLYYQVERVEPTRDGVLRKFTQSPSDDEIGRTYGSGVYWVTKHEGSRPVVYREVRISSAYGQTRTPRATDAQPGSASDRTGYTPRMLERIRAMRATSEEEEPTSSRAPFYRRPYLERAPYRERERDDDPDRSALAEFGRRGTDESVAVAAIQQLGKLHEHTLKQRESEAKSGPQALITNFFEKQHTLAEQQRSQERKREEERLADERKRQEEQRREEDRRWERRQEEIAAQHKRDMERLEKEAENREKIERDRMQGILELYDKRMAIAEQEAKNREQRLKDELERSRQDAKEDREKLMAKITELSQESQQRVQEMQEELKEELEKERGNLNQHHSIKMKALENEHSLRQEMLKLREDMIKNQSSDGVEKMLGKLAEGVERTVKEVVDLKKIQAVGGLSPEAQAAHVVQGADGNVRDPQTETAQPSTVAPPKIAPAEQPAGNGAGVGATAGNGVTPSTEEGANMESEVVANMQKPFFQEVLKEWALHVESGNDATAFANMFMEWMRDDSTPDAAAARKACGGFTTFISVRTWAQVFKTLKPALPKDKIAVFETQDAEVFYETFRTMVVESVRDYWKSYLAAKQAEREALQQQRRAAAPPEEAQKASA